ncbi:MAG: mannose-1-phosphate guanylyltransferase [Anaerolineae bacterium]
MVDHLYAVIMAGGGGTRLWPLSRQHHPKQTLSLSGERTLFQTAVDRLLPLMPLERIYVVTAADQAEALALQYPQLPRENLIVEPLAGGTASCIGLAALHLRHLDPEAVMAVVTADHYIEDVDGFRRSLMSACQLASQGYLVTLGITPTFPATGFGYICLGARLPEAQGFDGYQVEAFTEKPSPEKAQEFLDAGCYVWNSGMFVWRADRILEEIARWMPALDAVLRELAAARERGLYRARLHELWRSLEKETIDYGIMERADRVVAIPVEIGWSDIGAWSSVMDVYEPDDEGNVLVGDVIHLDTENTMVISQGQRLIVAIGVEDLIVVDTPDALLVTGRQASQRVREIVDYLRSTGRDDLL